MSEEEKAGIEESFRIMFAKIKEQLRKEIKEEKERGFWDDFIVGPGPNTSTTWGPADGFLKDPKQAFNEMGEITADEIIEFSQNIKKIKDLNGKKELERESS